MQETLGTACHMAQLVTAAEGAQTRHCSEPDAQRAAVETAIRGALRAQLAAVHADLTPGVTLTLKPQSMGFRRRVCEGSGALGFGHSLVHTVFKQMQDIMADRQATQHSSLRAAGDDLRVKSQLVQTLLLLRPEEVRGGCWAHTHARCCCGGGQKHRAGPSSAKLCQGLS